MPAAPDRRLVYVCRDYDAEPYTTFCLGPRYALLRPEFLRPEGFGAAPARSRFCRSTP